MTDSVEALAQYALDRLAAAGAEQADVLMERTHSLSAQCRMRAPELVERSEAQDIGLRALVGQRQAFVSAAGWNGREAVDALAQRAVEMARRAPPDPWCGMAEDGALAQDLPQLDLHDARPAEASQLLEVATAMEEIALAQDKISNSEGASASWGESEVALATSRGFFGATQSSAWSRGCVVLAGANGAQERDYAGHTARHASDLESVDVIAQRAARRATRRLGARKLKSEKLPVLYDRRVAASLLGSFLAAINGQAIARGTSFLKDACGEQIFADGMEIVDEPHRLRGLGSAGFDGEGAAMQNLTLIRNGKLQDFLLDSASARQLERTSNARAGRTPGAPPYPTSSNCHIQPGTQSREELRRSLKRGFYVTEMIGRGTNLLTGDYSRGAVGFLIEDGELAFPIHEVTLAGNLKDMFRHLVAGKDLEFRSSVNAPSLLVEEMTLAGL